MILYKKNKNGTIQAWEIDRAGQGRLKISFGQENGKKQINFRQCVSKNVGKKNETSPEEQAEKELQSLVLKQIDKGYFKSKYEAENNIVYRPMLAHTWSNHKDKIVYPCFVQPKLDGVRSLIHGDLSQKKIFSRKGKEYINLKHIIKAIDEIDIPKNIILDGEVYLHGLDIQEINQKVKKYRDTTKNLQLWAYDLYDMNQPDLGFVSRFDMLEKILEHVNQAVIKITDTYYCARESKVAELTSQILSEGFEGSIVRGADSPYLLNHRSQQLLKVKEFLDEEFKIIGFSSGKDKYEGCVTWKCITRPMGEFEAEEFDVVPKGNIEFKRDQFNNAAKYIGKMLKVKYFDKTQKNIPRFPVGLTIRLEED